MFWCFSSRARATKVLFSNLFVLGGRRQEQNKNKNKNKTQNKNKKKTKNKNKTLLSGITSLLTFWCF